MSSKLLLVALHHTTLRRPTPTNSTPYPSQKLPHGISTANPHMMDQFPCVCTGTLSYFTVPNRLRISPSRTHLPPSRLLALPTRLDIQCTSYHTITPTFAKIPHEGRLHVFIFKEDNDDYTAVISLYAFQCGHKTHITSTHTPPDKPIHPK